MGKQDIITSREPSCPLFALKGWPEETEEFAFSLRLGGAALLETLGQIARVRKLQRGKEGKEFISDKYKTNTFR